MRQHPLDCAATRQAGLAAGGRWLQVPWDNAPDCHQLLLAPLQAVTKLGKRLEALEASRTAGRGPLCANALR
jgi:hypothetical protein